MTQTYDIGLNDICLHSCETNWGFSVYTGTLAQHPAICPFCSSKLRNKPNNKRERLIHDITPDDERIDLKIVFHQYRCPSCTKTFYEQCDSIDSSSVTKRFREKIVDEVLTNGYLGYRYIGKSLKISSSTVMRIMQEEARTHTDVNLYAPNELWILSYDTKPLSDIHNKDTTQWPVYTFFILGDIKLLPK